MISVRAPAGASMAYRLDPYSIEVISAKPKSMHDVVEPTILFYHRKQKGGAAPTPASQAKKNHRNSPTNSTTASSNGHFSPSGSTRSAPRTPAIAPNPTPSKTANPASPGSIRYVTVSTTTNPSITLIAPFRVAPGDAVVFQSNDHAGEHFGTVSHVYDATYAPNPNATIRRLIRKARSADQEAQRSNAKEIEVVRSTITAVLQNYRPGGFGSSSLSAVEWQLDRALLNVQLAYDPAQEGDLHALYLELVKQLGCEVYIITTMTPTSSPALSDCGNSSIGEYGDYAC